MAYFSDYFSLFKKFLRFGFLAWGGPIAQIALMHEEIVSREKWISEDKFKKVLGVYQALPGPEATELAVYFGYHKLGRLGGLLSGLGFVLPGFFLVLILSYIYATFGLQLAPIQAFLYGVKPAIIALIAIAVYKIGSRALSNNRLWLVAVLVSLAYFFVPVDLVVLIFLGAIAYFLVSLPPKKNLGAEMFFPLLVSANFAGNGRLFDIFLFFLKAGLLTFGGAYTVIPFVQAGAIHDFGWLSQSQFIDGLALSAVVPGPLIIVSTFVGYMAGGFFGAVLATVAVFLPAFAFTLLGFNAIEKIVENKRLQVFLDGLTASVVAVIAMASLGLAREALVGLFSLAVFAVSFLALWRFKANIAVVLVGSGLLGLAVKLLGFL